MRLVFNAQRKKIKKKGTIRCARYYVKVRCRADRTDSGTCGTCPPPPPSQFLLILKREQIKNKLKFS